MRLQLLVGLGIALVLHQLVLGRGVLRTIVLIPLGVPTIVAGVMFTYLFGGTGYLNEILHRLGLSSARSNGSGVIGTASESSCWPNSGRLLHWSP